MHIYTYVHISTHHCVPYGTVFILAIIVKRMTDSIEMTTPPKSTKSRNSNFSVQIQIKLKFQFQFVEIVFILPNIVERGGVHSMCVCVCLSDTHTYMSKWTLQQATMRLCVSQWTLLH